MANSFIYMKETHVIQIKVLAVYSGVVEGRKNFCNCDFRNGDSLERK